MNITKRLARRFFIRGRTIMMQSIGYVLVAGIAMGTIALLGFLWGVKHGAFENAEDAKYIVFRDEDDDD